MTTTKRSVNRLTEILFHERAAEAFDRANMLEDYMGAMQSLTDFTRAMEALIRKGEIKKKLNLNQFKERNQFKW